MSLNLDLNSLGGTMALSAFVLFIIYRRFRRNFGRQRLRRWRLKFRIYLLAVIALILLPFAFFSAERALATAVGLGIGLTLGAWAAKHTRFLKDGDKLYYIPHTYTGIVVSALFFGRLIYRIVALSSSVASLAAMEAQGGNPGDFGGWSTIAHNPLTRGLFFILVGYYIYYYSYVLHESEHLKPGDWEQPPAPGNPPAGGNLPGKSG